MHNFESPRSDDAGMEARLQAVAVAPRVSLAQLHDTIVNELYIQPQNTTLTICVLTLRNGFTVIGESAAASPQNFDEVIGRQLARTNAVNKIWPLEGYLLRQRLHEESLPRAMDVDAIARMCHEVNRAYCQFLGDNSQPAWEDAPDWQKQSARMGVMLHLGNSDAGPQASHESWMAQKVAEGWTWGPTKDPEKKQHHCMVPFAELPREQQAKDWLFRGVVHAMASAGAAGL